MIHPLQQRVEAIRRKAVRLVRAHAVARLLLVAIVVVALFALADYLLRLQDPGARWIVSGCALAALVWAAWQFLGPAIGYRLGLVQTAQRIEAVWPQLDQRLSSAVDFLAQDERDQTAGSADLRRAVVAQTESLATSVDFRQAIDTRQPRNAWLLALAAAMFAVGMALIVDEGKAASLALARLAMPWQDLAWPRRNTLQFAHGPAKLAVGDDFEVEVVDRSGRLPERVQLQLRFATPTGTRTETKEMKPLADRMVLRLDNVTQGFAYRARGGDDDSMPWTQLQVIEPPKVTALEIAVTPPAYTGLPPAPAGRVVRAIAGSALTLRGRTDKPVVAARLRCESPTPSLPSMLLGVGGLSFAAPADVQQPWTIDKSAAYWVELTDASGLVTGRDTRLEVQSVADSPPTISWETPGDHTFVTPRAVVAVKGLVKDDLTIRGVQLRYLRPGISDEGEQVVELFAGPPQAKPTGGMEAGESRTFDHAWDLSRLAGLQPGDVLAVRITAEDYRPQLATSIVHRLTIITDQELESRLGQRQTSILSQLAEALRIQRECRGQLAALQIRWEETGKLDESGLSQLQSAQLNQRQVEKLLSSGPEGAEGQIVALLGDLVANRVEGRAIGERMNELLAKVQALNREPIVEIAQQLTEAFKMVREATDACQPADAAQSLRSAAASQDEVIQSLEALLGQLTQWDSFSRLAREIGQIRGEQQKLSDETESLRLMSLGAAAPPAEQRTGSRQLASSQLELARRLDKIQVRMEEMLHRLQASDPIASGTLADALEAARRLAIGGQMRDAAGKLSQQQLGESQSSQSAVLSGLAELLDLLSSRREDELARTVKALRAAAGDLTGLRQQQQAVQAEIDAAAAEPTAQQQQRRLQRLTKELERLTEQIEALGRRLQRLQAPRAAAAMQQASQASAAAGKSAAQGSSDDAQQQSRQVQRRLEEAQQETEQAIAQAEQQLAQQQLARMEQWIEGLVARQTNVVAEAKRLDEMKMANQGELTAAQSQTLRNLAAEQRLVADETEGLRQKLTAAAFVFALEGARQEMLRAAALLERAQTDATTQGAAQSAADRLAQMLAALKPDEGSPPADPPAGQPPPPAPPAGQKDPFSSLAELKLLQLLQGEINRQTDELAAIRAQSGKLSDEQTQQQERLAAEQGRLAEMVFELIRETAARPEDDLEALPDPLPEGRPQEN